MSDPTGLDAFRARCEARALLWEAAEFECAPSWHDAANDYDRVKIAPNQLDRLHKLMADNVTLDRAWSETSQRWRVEGRAARSTFKALMLGLRERGTAALAEPAVRERLSLLS